MVPVLAAANVIAFNLAIVRRYRTHVFAIGIVDPFYVVEHGRIVIQPWFIEFDETMVRIALVLVNISAIVVPTIVELADIKDDLRRKYVLQSWPLRQLVS